MSSTVSGSGNVGGEGVGVRLIDVQASLGGNSVSEVRGGDGSTGGTNVDDLAGSVGRAGGGGDAVGFDLRGCDAFVSSHDSVWEVRAGDGSQAGSLAGRQLDQHGVGGDALGFRVVGGHDGVLAHGLLKQVAAGISGGEFPDARPEAKAMGLRIEDAEGFASHNVLIAEIRGVEARGISLEQGGGARMANMSVLSVDGDLTTVGVSVEVGADLELRSSLLSEYGDVGVVNDDVGVVGVHYSLLWKADGDAANSAWAGAIEESNNLSVDPLLRDDLSLGDGSPAIDAGDPAADCGDEPTPPVGGFICRVDIGHQGNTPQGRFQAP